MRVWIALLTALLCANVALAQPAAAGGSKYAAPPLSVTISWTGSGTFGADFKAGGQTVTVSGPRLSGSQSSTLACEKASSNCLFTVGNLVCVIEECESPKDHAFVTCYDGMSPVIGPIQMIG